MAASTLPDLVLQSGTFSPTTIRPGATMTMDATVRNAGVAAAGQSLLEYWLLSDPNATTGFRLGGANVESLAAGAVSANKHLSIVFPGSSSIPP
ncbi:MAG: hypothetical protein HY315_08310, partial [Acidobacteria bacterium]|nr:hypothetical protein [Acidobacteriota bacterium]